MRVWVGHERLRAQKKTERWGRGSAKGGEGGGRSVVARRNGGGGAIGDGRGRSPSHSPVASHANSTSPLSAISGYRQTR